MESTGKESTSLSLQIMMNNDSELKEENEKKF